LADAGWVHGSLVEPPIEEEPDVPVGATVEVLANAEEIVNAISADAVAEARARDVRASWRRWFRRRR